MPGIGRRFQVLEGLRGVSALAVMFMHLGGPGGEVFSHGYLAVDLFFIISGVVIASAYEERLRSGWSAAAFMGARVRRLAPLYLLGTALGAGCALAAHLNGYGGDGPILFNLALAVLFVPALFSSGELYPLNSPSWSLFAEMVANLAYGAAARSLSRATLIWLATLGAAAVIVIALRSGVDANVGVSGGDWIGGIARVAFGFPFGVLLYRLHARGRLHVPRLAAPLVVASGLMSFVAPFHGPLYDLAVILVLYPLLTACALGGSVKRGSTAAVFAAAGAISYPLYALHYPFAKLARLYMPTAGVAGALAVLFCGGAIVAASFVAQRLFDEPVRSWLERRAGKVAAAVAVA
ncbi:MAG: acyltransferase family protein [Caulobacteraceae bacterium]